MEEVLAKAVVAGHRVNRYTGTDYSGIEALRRQIGEQGEIHYSIKIRRL